MPSDVHTFIESEIKTILTQLTACQGQARVFCRINEPGGTVMQQNFYSKTRINKRLAFFGEPEGS